MGPPNPSRETKFSGANGDREIFIFPVQLATSRIGNLTRLIPYTCYMYDHTYIGYIYIYIYVFFRPRESRMEPITGVLKFKQSATSYSFSC